MPVWMHHKVHVCLIVQLILWLDLQFVIRLFFLAHPHFQRPLQACICPLPTAKSGIFVFSWPAVLRQTRPKRSPSRHPTSRHHQGGWLERMTLERLGGLRRVLSNRSPLRTSQRKAISIDLNFPLQPPPPHLANRFTRVFCWCNLHRASTRSIYR